MMPPIRRTIEAFDRFLFQGCEPRLIPLMRVGFGLIILIQTIVNWIDAAHWFTDAGVLRIESAQRVSGPGSWSLLYLLPSTEFTVKACLVLMVGHSILMMLGVASRIQAAALFIWLVSFQNRNPFIIDGEDFVFRIFAFLFIWLPLDSGWSVWRRYQGNDSPSIPQRASAWGLRLVQIEMTAIYASTAFCKAQGVSWWNGTAVWFVTRLSDDYGRLVPISFFDLTWTSAVATWGTLLLEFSIPLALWIRPLRNYAVLAGFALHLGIEISMNLFLFQWVMMLGLLAFIDLERFPFKRNSPLNTHDASEPVRSNTVRPPLETTNQHGKC